MPREFEMFGIILPSLIPLLLLAGAISWCFDSLLARTGFFQFVWHPALFRISMTVLLFCGFGLQLFSE